MQRHSALTFQFPRACWICYFTLILLGRVLCWYVGTASSSPSPPCTQCPGKGFQKWLASLRCVMSGIVAAPFSQLTFQKVLNIRVLLHGHLTPHLGHSKSSAFQPVPFQITPDPWCTTVLNLEAKI